MGERWDDADARRRGAGEAGEIGGAGETSGAAPAGRAAALAAMAHDPDPVVRKTVAVGLGRADDPAATGILCDMLEDGEEGVRVLACQALGRRRDPSSLGALASAAHDPSAQVRAGVIFAIASIAAYRELGEAEADLAFGTVVVTAFDPDDGVRADAAAALGTTRLPRAAEPLLVLLEDEAPRVRANACASLGVAVPCADPALDGQVTDALVGRALDASEETLVRVSAVDGLARRAERGLLGEDARQEAALDAVLGAVRTGEGEAPASLDGGELAGGDGGSAAGDCATGDGMGGTPSALRQTALWALGILPVPERRADQVADALIAALGDSEEWCRRYAAEALARRGGSRGLAALRELARNAREGRTSLGEQELDLLQGYLGGPGTDEEVG